MGKYVKKVLIFSAFLLCLFALTVLGASAYTVDESEASTTQETAVASVTDGTNTYFYASLETAIADAISNTDDTNVVTVLKDATVDSAIALTSELSIVGVAGDGEYPTINFTGFTVAAGAAPTLTAKNVNFVSTSYFVEFAGNDVGTCTFSFTSVNVSSPKDLFRGPGSTKGTLKLTIDDATAGGPSTTSEELVWSANNGRAYLIQINQDTATGSGTLVLDLDINDITFKGAIYYGRNEKLGTSDDYALFTNVHFIQSSDIRNICNFGASTVYVKLKNCVSDSAYFFIHNMRDTSAVYLEAENTVFNNTGTAQGIFGHRRTTTDFIKLTDCELNAPNAPGIFYTHASKYSPTWNVEMTNVKINAKALYYRGDGITDPVGFNLTLNNVENTGDTSIVFDFTNVLEGSTLNIANSPDIDIAVVPSENLAYILDADTAAGLGYVRLGDAVESGVIGVNFFFTVSDAVAAAQSNQTVYVLATQNITGDMTVLPAEGVTGVKIQREGFTGTMFNITAGTLTIANVEIPTATNVFVLSGAGSLVIGDADTTVMTNVHGDVFAKSSSLISVSAANTGSITLEADSVVGIDTISFVGTDAEIRVINIGAKLTGSFVLKGCLYAIYNGTNTTYAIPANDAEAGTGVSFKKEYNGLIRVAGDVTGGISISGKLYNAQGTNWSGILLAAAQSGKLTITNADMHFYSTSVITTSANRMAEIEIGQDAIIRNTPTYKERYTGIVYFRGGKQILRVKDNAQLISGVEGDTENYFPTFYFGGTTGDTGAILYFEDNITITNYTKHSTYGVIFYNDPCGFDITVDSTITLNYNKIRYNTGNKSKRPRYMTVETAEFFGGAPSSGTLTGKTVTATGEIKLVNADDRFIGYVHSLAAAVSILRATDTIQICSDLNETDTVSLTKDLAVKIVGIAKTDGTYPIVTFAGNNRFFNLASGNAERSLTVENLNFVVNATYFIEFYNGANGINHLAFNGVNITSSNTILVQFNASSVATVDLTINGGADLAKPAKWTVYDGKGFVAKKDSSGGTGVALTVDADNMIFEGSFLRGYNITFGTEAVPSTFDNSTFIDKGSNDYVVCLLTSSHAYLVYNDCDFDAYSGFHRPGDPGGTAVYKFYDCNFKYNNQDKGYPLFSLRDSVSVTIEMENVNISTDYDTPVFYPNSRSASNGYPTINNLSFKNVTLDVSALFGGTSAVAGMTATFDNVTSVGDDPITFDLACNTASTLDIVNSALKLSITNAQNLVITVDLQCALTMGYIFRVGEAVEKGALGVVYFSSLKDAINAIPENTVEDGVVTRVVSTIYVLRDGVSIGSIPSIYNKSFRLTSVGITEDGALRPMKVTVTQGNPFCLYDSSQLIVGYIDITCTQRFFRFETNQYESDISLVLENGATVRAVPNASTDGAFIFCPFGEGKITVDIQEGATIVREGAGKSHGLLFNLTQSGFAEGSTVTIAGTLQSTCTLPSGGDFSLFRCASPNVVLTIKPTARFITNVTGTKANSSLGAMIAHAGPIILEAGGTAQAPQFCSVGSDVPPVFAPQWATTSLTVLGNPVLSLGTVASGNYSALYTNAPTTCEFLATTSDEVAADWFGALYRVGDIPAEGGKVGTVYFKTLTAADAADGDLTLEMLHLIADTESYADDAAASAAGMLYRVGNAGGRLAWVYFSDEGEATVMARISGKEMMLLGITSIEAAISRGAVVRLGGAVAAGQMDVHYFTSFESALAAAIAAGENDIQIYFLVSGETITATQTLSNVKLTLASATETRQTLTMSANPAFKLDAGAYLVIANLAISVPDAFALIINADTAATVQLDLEAGTLIDIAYAASSNGHGYLLKTQASVPTGKILANVKEGATVRRVSTTATKGNSYGLFQFRSDGNNCVAGSKITISGSIYFSLNYTASGCAPVVMLGNVGRLDVAFTETAYVELMHTGAIDSTWSAVVCYEGNGASVHMTGATFKLGDHIALIGFNGASFTSADVIIDGVSIETDAAYIINDYASPVGTANTSPITFRNMTLPKGKQLGVNNALVNASLENMSFESVADAAAYGAALKVDALTGYYNMYAALKAVSDGGSILVLADHTQISQATATGKSFTLRSADGGSYKITGGFVGGNLGERLFVLKGACNMTVQNLTIEANSRVFLFQSTTKAAPASLTLQNAKVTSLATGNGANAILCVGNNTTEYFDLYIDAQSELGYRDAADTSVLAPGRNYQVIFYYGSVTGDIRIDGHVYSYVYCNGSNVRYDASVVDSGNAYAPDAQYMIQIGNDLAHTFTGDIVITGRLTMKVVYADADLNAYGVSAAHTAYAFYSYMAGASLFVADGAVITLELTNASPVSGLAGFACGAVSERVATYAPAGATVLTGKLYYTGIAGDLAFRQKYEYDGEYVTINSTYVPVYDKDIVWKNAKNSSSAQHEFGIANGLAALLTELLGTTVTARDDSTTTAHEILIGRVDRAQVNTYLPTLGANEYTILMVDGKLLLLAWQDDALLRGANDLYQILTLCLNDEGVIRIPAALLAGAHVANDRLLSDFTRPTGENIEMSGAQYVGDNSLQVLYTGAGVGEPAYNAYIATLLAEGYTLVWENSIEGSAFKMLEHRGKGIALYVAYNAYAYADFYNDKYENEAIADTLEGRFLTDFLANGFTKCIRVISAPISAVINSDPGISTPNPAYTKVTDSMMVTIGIPSGQVGMGYVIMLEDGRFLVVDGGRNADGATDVSDAIWNVMLELYEKAYGEAPTAQRPIHVAAWYLTHAHSDHYGSFKALLTTLTKKERVDLFKMDYMIGNFPAVNSIFGSMDWDAYEDDVNTMKTNVKGGFKFLKVHTGQKLYLANVEMEVLLTYEDHLPYRIINTNDTNTVIRITLNNKDALPGTVAPQVLFLGDSWRYSSRILCAMYGEYLQTEILQLAHHGNIGCEKLLYQIIAPKAVLFPHCTTGFRQWVWTNSTSGSNAYAPLADRYLVLQAEFVRYVWAAVERTYNTLVFTPAGPDYKNVYDLLTGTRVTYSSNMSEQPLYIDRGTDVISVNVVWGDLSFFFEAGEWNPETHEYEGGSGWQNDGDSTVTVENAGDIDVSVGILYTAAGGYEYITGAITDEEGATVAENAKYALPTLERYTFNFELTGTDAPSTPLDDVTVGSITVTVTRAGG